MRTVPSPWSPPACSGFCIRTRQPSKPTIPSATQQGLRQLTDASWKSCHRSVYSQGAAKQSQSQRVQQAAAGGRGGLLITAVRKPAAQIKRTKSSEEVVTRQRLSKVLAAAGVASRRAAEDLIFAGEVKLNGQVVTAPQTLAHPQQDKIEVKGKVVTAQPQRKFYFAVNKPKGYLCSTSAPEGEGGSGRLVLDLIGPWLDRFRREHPRGTRPPRLFPVGRLDVPSVGLLFVTNDGQWAQKVLHPSSGLTKEYIATVDKPATRKQIDNLRLGCDVDGVHVTPVAAGLDISDPAANDRKIRIVVAEGRNREVRTLLANVGLEVTFLKRVRIGGYRLPKDLSLGGMRPLKPNEVRRILDRGAESL